MAQTTLQRVLVRVDVAAAEGGFAVRDFDHVKHPISVEEVVRAAREELGIGAVADVDAVEAAREGALHQLTRRRWKLVDRGVVSGEDLLRID